MVSRQEEYQYAEDLNNALTKAIVSKCKGKKVLLSLTGGMDSRALLSIFFKNGIEFDAFVVYLKDENQQYWAKKDVKTAIKLSRYYGFTLKIHYIGWHPWQESLRLVKNDYDIVVSGDGFTECLCRYDSYRKGYAQRNGDEAQHFLYSKEYGYYAPIWEKEVQKIVRKIPMYRRIFSIPQREIVRLNHPKLLTYGYTSFNLRRHIYSKIYRFLVWSKRI